MDEKLNEILRKLDQLSDRVSKLESPKLSFNYELVEEPAGTDFDDGYNEETGLFDIQQYSDEAIQRLLNDIFADQPKKTVEYNMLDANVIEFPVKFSRQ